MAVSRYRYPPLTSDSSFRLFRIPKKGHELGNQIQIHLSEADFRDAPAFEAISYAWGQDHASSKILCNEECLFVTPNVEAVLRMLTGQESDAAFWIDSICIDQCSVSEKNIQVPRMQSIYSQARLVWVWLGPETFETVTAMRFLVEVTELLKQKHQMEKNRTPGTEDELSKLHAQFRGKVRFRRGFYDAVDTNFIVDLLHLPWFHRTWTVQELVLATSAVFVCGPEQITYAELLSTLGELQSHELAESSHTSRSNPASYYDDETKCYRELTKYMWYFGCQSKISAILRTVRSKTSSKPEDKVYGVYGILNYLRLENLPQVRYDRAVHTIFTEITSAAIRIERSLDILYSTCLPQLINNLPSWVPDWSNSAYHRPILLNGLHADGGTFSDAPFRITHDQLVVHGNIIDRIRECAESSSIAMASFRRGYNARINSDETDKRRTGVLELVKTLQAWFRLSLTLQQYPTDATPLEAFYDIILQNSSLVGKFQAKALKDILDTCMQIITSNLDGSTITLEALHDAIREVPEYEATVADYSQVFERDKSVETWPEELQIRLFLRLFSPGVAAVQHDITLNTYHKTLFVSRDGYMGTCVRWSRNGDMIAVIAGLKVPFVLREQGMHYKLVGPAYVHGVMHGERWSTEDMREIMLV